MICWGFSRWAETNLPTFEFRWWKLLVAYSQRAAPSQICKAVALYKACNQVDMQEIRDLRGAAFNCNLERLYFIWPFLIFKTRIYNLYIIYYLISISCITISWLHNTQSFIYPWEWLDGLHRLGIQIILKINGIKLNIYIYFNISKSADWNWWR